MCKLVSVQEKRQVRALNEATDGDLNETMTKKGKFYLELLRKIWREIFQAVSDRDDFKIQNYR